MTILKILQYPDQRLHRIGTVVTNVQNPRIQNIIKDMFETLHNTENCAGLSATQLDIDNPPRITVIGILPGSNKQHCLINPEIIHKEGESINVEGCMSVYPDAIQAKVKRATKIIFTALDPDGNNLTIEAEDFFAICVQHEIDHLNGILYIDHLSKLKRSRIEHKIRKL